MHEVPVPHDRLAEALVGWAIGEATYTMTVEEPNDPGLAQPGDPFGRAVDWLVRSGHDDLAARFVFAYGEAIAGHLDTAATDPAFVGAICHAILVSTPGDNDPSYAKIVELYDYGSHQFDRGDGIDI